MKQRREKFESVHLAEFPKATFRDKALKRKWKLLKELFILTRAMRAKNNLKVRQPLKKIMVALDKSKHEALSKMKDVILEEVNIKELAYLN